jgi:hypothetical protein
MAWASVRECHQRGLGANTDLDGSGQALAIDSESLRVVCTRIHRQGGPPTTRQRNTRRGAATAADRRIAEPDLDGAALSSFVVAHGNGFWVPHEGFTHRSHCLRDPSRLGRSLGLGALSGVGPGKDDRCNAYHAEHRH